MDWLIGALIRVGLVLIAALYVLPNIANELTGLLL